MLFLLFGGGIRFKDLGAGHEHTCRRCHNTATWSRLRRFHELTRPRSAATNPSAIATRSR